MADEVGESVPTRVEDLLEAMRNALLLYLSAPGDQEQHKQSMNQCMGELMDGCTDDEYVEGWRLIRLLGAYEKHGTRPPECCVTSANCIHARTACARAVWREGMPFFPLGILPPEDQDKLAQGASGAGLPAEYKNAVVYMNTERSDRRRQQALEVATVAALTVLSSGDEASVHNRLQWLNLWTSPDIGLDADERLQVAAETLGRPAESPDLLDAERETVVLNSALAKWGIVLKNADDSEVDSENLLIGVFKGTWRDQSTRQASRYAAAASSNHAADQRSFPKAQPSATPP